MSFRVLLETLSSAKDPPRGIPERGWGYLFWGISQRGYPKGGYAQRGYPQKGYPLWGCLSGVFWRPYLLQKTPQRGVSPKGMGIPPLEYLPKGTPQRRVSPKGVFPKGYPLWGCLSGVFWRPYLLQKTPQRGYPKGMPQRVSPKGVSPRGMSFARRFLPPHAVPVTPLRHVTSHDVTQLRHSLTSL